MRLAICCLLLLLCSAALCAQENCANAVDDDNDGLVDLHDPDCQCHFEVQGNLLQNGSFEQFNHCPLTYTYNDDATIINHWQLGTYTNGNEAIYYHNLSCAFDSAQVMLFLPPARPMPDGDGFVSIRQYVYRKPFQTEKDIAKIYVGQCLQTALVPGESYTLSFNAGRFQSNDDTAFKFKNEPFTVAIYGNKACTATPFGTAYAPSNGCPANYEGWTLLGKTTVWSKGRWVQSRIDFSVPEEINAIQIGPDCSIPTPETELPDSTTLLDFYVYHLDDLHLLPKEAFQFPHIQKSGTDPCAPDSLLMAPALAGASYQWYKDSLAIAGATNASYAVLKNSNAVYNVRLVRDGGCAISEPFSASQTTLGGLRLPADTVFCSGETVLLINSQPGTEYNWRGLWEQDVAINKSGTYAIKARQNDCKRSFTVIARAVDCSNADVYIPTAFTPNNDGKNDLFQIPMPPGVQLKQLLIFNRWGQQVFASSAATPAWDGTCKGKKCEPGAYVYFAKLRWGNTERIVKGVVAIIR